MNYGSGEFTLMNGVRKISQLVASSLMKKPNYSSVLVNNRTSVSFPFMENALMSETLQHSCYFRKMSMIHYEFEVPDDTITTLISFKMTSHQTLLFFFFITNDGTLVSS